MAKTLNRDLLIRRGKLLRRVSMIANKMLLLTSKKKSYRKEIYLDTEFGKARTLWYGFEKKERTPVFFDLHGGGFILGSADMDDTMCLEFNRQAGCKVISIEYCKAPDYPYPAAVNQVFAIIKKFVENADKYAIDVQKMGIGGHSAGGNLSTVACMMAKKEGKFQFACQVLDYPPLDLATNVSEKPRPSGGVPPWMAAVFNASYVDPARAKEPYASPVFAAHEDLSGQPPALFIVAGRDSLHDEGLKYCAMLEAAGVITECHDYPNAAHGFTLNSSSDTTDAIAKMAAFLKKYLQ
jgi:acetyl esterase